MVFIDCTPNATDTYYYGRQQFDDRGWGCVYRSAQTTLATLGYARGERPMPHVLDMMSVLGVDVHEAPGQMWIEPKQVRDLLIEYSGPLHRHGQQTTQQLTWHPRLIGIGVAGNTHLLRRTVPGDFGTTYSDWRLFHNDVVRHLRNHDSPVVVDDGISGLCVTGFRGEIGSGSGEYLLVDPHVTVPGTQFRTVPVTEFYNTPMMMALVS